MTFDYPFTKDMQVEILEESKSKLQEGSNEFVDSWVGEQYEHSEV